MPLKRLLSVYYDSCSLKNNFIGMIINNNYFCIVNKQSYLKLEIFNILIICYDSYKTKLSMNCCVYINHTFTLYKNNIINY